MVALLLRDINCTKVRNSANEKLSAMPLGLIAMEEEDTLLTWDVYDSI